MLRFTIVLTAVAAGCVSPPAVAQQSLPGLSGDAERYIRQEMRERHIPGLAVAVVRNGNIVALASYGLADVENAVPVSSASLFPIASLDKQLTSTGIMLLVNDGKLKLDDEIMPSFESAPAAWRGIRVRHLISHTSGLPDLLGYASRPFISYTTADLLDEVKDQSLLFPPGTAYRYSDEGMFLSQLITERASGMPWYTFMRARVFDPAGMTTARSMDPSALVPHRVEGYWLQADGTLVPNRRYATDFGPLYNDFGCTILDFAHWAAALQTNRVMPQPLRDQMWEAETPAHEMLYWSSYGFGWGVDRYRGVRVILHSGHTGMGIVMLPEQQTAAIVFTNLDNRFGTDAQGLALGVAGMYAPGVSLLALPKQTDPQPGRTKRFLDDFLKIYEGKPEYTHFSPALYLSVLDATSDFATRRPHFGAFSSLTFLGTLHEENRDVDYFRADFAHARMFLRAGYEADGKIDYLQAMHI